MQIMPLGQQTRTFLMGALCLLAIVLLATGGQPAEASQGCPFDDGSCQDYCAQQGCNLGYCGHFAWIQCICRKCGDEWSWYDKVRYNPDKTVNQTELDSLKLNGTAPLILTNSSARPTAKTTVTQASQPAQQVVKVLATTTQQQQQQPEASAKPAATLTTLLIPDLSDGSKVDLNDIPDEENSEKFLDYLAKNHEKLVQAQHNSNQRSQQQPADDDDNDDQQPDPEESADQQVTTPTTTTTTGGTTSDNEEEGETVEIQISSSNNNSQQQQQQPHQVEGPNPRQGPSSGQVARLLRMAVADEQQLGSDLELDS